jgi:hypothetical protein
VLDGRIGLGVQNETQIQSHYEFGKLRKSYKVLELLNGVVKLEDRKKS